MGWYNKGEWTNASLGQLHFILSDLCCAINEREYALGIRDIDDLSDPWRAALSDAQTQGSSLTMEQIKSSSRVKHMTRWALPGMATGITYPPPSAFQDHNPAIIMRWANENLKPPFKALHGGVYADNNDGGNSLNIQFTARYTSGLPNTFPADVDSLSNTLSESAILRHPNYPYTQAGLVPNTMLIDAEMTPVTFIAEINRMRRALDMHTRISYHVGWGPPYWRGGTRQPWKRRLVKQFVTDTRQGSGSTFTVSTLSPQPYYKLPTASEGQEWAQESWDGAKSAVAAPSEGPYPFDLRTGWVQFVEWVPVSTTPGGPGIKPTVTYHSRVWTFFGEVDPSYNWLNTFWLSGAPISGGIPLEVENSIQNMTGATYLPAQWQVAPSETPLTWAGGILIGNRRLRRNDDFPLSAVPAEGFGGFSLPVQIKLDPIPDAVPVGPTPYSPYTSTWGTKRPGTSAVTGQYTKILCNVAGTLNWKS